jgi:alkylation response protein AidB-like acyl-CoA dehydrogenase
MSADELAQLRDAVRDACTKSGGTAAARALAEQDAGWDPAAWSVLTEQIGLGGLALPEETGGLGGLAEVAVVSEELGYHLLPVPFLSSTVQAGQVLRGCGTAAFDSLAEIAAGEVYALVAVDGDGVWSADRLTVHARPAGEDWLLDGNASFVFDGLGARALVVVADAGEGPDLFVVRGADASVTVRPMTTLDLARSQAVVGFASTPAVRLTGGGLGGAIVDAAMDFSLVALAAEQLGGAQACLDMTVEYVKMRRQFGREIGSFQAVKHRCADMLAQVEFCRTAVTRAVEVEHEKFALSEAAAVAQSWCSEAFLAVAAETVHLHGGIGFTWEHDAHLYFRRARADAVAFGGAAHHRERLPQLLAW